MCKCKTCKCKKPEPSPVNPDKGLDEYGHYGENNPPLPMSPVGDKDYES